MQTILYLLQKEFLQIFRNKTLLPLIFVLPVVQLLVLVNAATFEMKRIDMVVVDQDLSASSRQLVATFSGSPFYHVQAQALSPELAQAALLNNLADVVLVIPNNLERDLVRQNTAKVQFLINAIDGMVAGLTNAYSTAIVRGFNKKLVADFLGTDQTPALPIVTEHRFWYNPELRYTIYMLPGILVILVTLIGMFLSALNIVREKETGTIEQVNVTPIRKHHFIIGKLLPFLIIALFELSFGLLLGKVLFDQPIVGSLWVIFALAFVYLLVALGLGLFLSAISQTQQQVMFSIFFFILVFVLMSGIFTPVDSMPRWAQWVNIVNPFPYFMSALRMVMLKGAGFADIAGQLLSLAVYAVVALSLAIWRYRKTA